MCILGLPHFLSQSGLPTVEHLFEWKGLQPSSSTGHREWDIHNSMTVCHVCSFYLFLLFGRTVKRVVKRVCCVCFSRPKTGRGFIVKEDMSEDGKRESCHVSYMSIYRCSCMSLSMVRSHPPLIPGPVCGRQDRQINRSKVWSGEPSGLAGVVWWPGEGQTDYVDVMNNTLL